MTYQITITNSYKPEEYRRPYNISPTIRNDVSEGEYLSDARTLDDGTIQIPLYKRSGYITLPTQSIWTFETNDSDEVEYYRNISIENVDTQIIIDEGEDIMFVVNAIAAKDGSCTLDATFDEIVEEINKNHVVVADITIAEDYGGMALTSLRHVQLGAYMDDKDIPELQFVFFGYQDGTRYEYTMHIWRNSDIWDGGYLELCWEMPGDPPEIQFYP